MNDTQDNPRAMSVLQFLTTKAAATRKEIEALFPAGSVSRITIIRTLNKLLAQGWITQSGGGKYVRYSLTPGKELLVPMNLDEYFKMSADVRRVRYSTFNADVLEKCSGLFSDQEHMMFEEGKKKLQERFSTVDPTIIKRELERFIIEFSWKSSQIEGNTYSLLETEVLIKQRKEAQGHSREEAVMILNHKYTFDTILANRESYRNISELDIRSVHAELMKELLVATSIRDHGVGITGTAYKPLGTKWQIEEALQRIVRYTNTISIPEKSFVLLAMLSYLQPFADGNKRTARMISNAVLLANGYYPLSYRSIDDVEFKKALILFYEQNNLHHLKRIFLEQQLFAIEQYFA